MIRIMICDDMIDIRKHYVECINTQPDMQVVCQAGATEEAIQNALEHRPDIILMDVQMDENDSGVIATERITRELPDTKVVMLTIHNDDDIVVDAYMAGAVDYMIKSSQAQEICEKIRRIYSTEDFLGRRVSNALRNKIIKAQKQERSIIYLINRMSKLTVTEQKILEQLYNKKKRKKIAAENYMSEETVKIHIRHILKKLQFSSTMEMVSELEKMGIMELYEKEMQ